jgi:hypothetical protein
MGFLIDQLGVRLMLLMGKTVPVPVSAEVVRALAQVEVTRDASGRDGFKLTFNVGKDITLDYALVNAGATGLLNRVIIAVFVGPVPEVLIDGVITMQQHQPQRDPGSSTFVVMGTDLMTMLDLKEKNDEFPNQPDFVIVQRLLLNYIDLAPVQMVLPTTDIPIFLQRIPRQAETDLTFIKRMAQRNGYVFFIDPVTLFVNRAYFGPETRLGIPLPALSMDSGSRSNVNQLSFRHDGLAPVGPELSFFEPITKVVLPIPPLPSLRIPPLAASPTPAARTVILRDPGNKGPAQALAANLAAVTTAPESVTGNGQVDTARYGAVLKARGLVGVRGAGLSYDGLYYVRRVTHRIDVRQYTYTQDFTISREGTGSLLPVVPPS